MIFVLPTTTTTNPNDIFGIIGILLEIAGFVIAFFAIQLRRANGGGSGSGSFTSHFSYLGNVMSTVHPKWSKTAVILVIIGLVFQLASQILRR
jgi:hypothetical protein